MLFTGLMLTADGPKVLEYNVRFGDPETEALVLLLDPETDLAAVLLVRPSPPAPANYLPDQRHRRVQSGDWTPWKSRYGKGSVCRSFSRRRVTRAVTPRGKKSLSDICLRVGGMSYYCSYIFTTRTDVVAFHAGTSTVNGKTVTSGGRVLCVSAYAPTLREALDAAYAGVTNVSFEGKVFRRDIAHR